MQLNEWLNERQQQRVLRAIDVQLALFVESQLGEKEHPLIAWAALISFELGKGNVCVDLNMIDPNGLFDLTGDAAKKAHEFLNFSNAIRLFETSDLVCDGGRATPFVFTNGRIYLHRCWQAEQVVAYEIGQRTKALSLPPTTRALLDDLFKPDIGLLKKILSGSAAEDRPSKTIDFFDVVKPEQVDTDAILTLIDTGASDDAILALVPDSTRLNWQKVAAAVALSYRFAVISGGPGTGKTTTVAKLLAALVSTNTSSKTLEIKLVAPTGKAANRLTESIGKAVSDLPVEQAIRDKIPIQASTIHRLLGAIPNRVGFKHNSNNRLHLDILVVDEASMVDLQMMARLLSALPDHARIILLGDKDQLASVEAGAVLGDICVGIAQGYSHARVSQLDALTGFELEGNDKVAAVSDGVCLLRKSYRFHAKSGVGQLAAVMNNGESHRLKEVWRRGFKDIAWYDLLQEGIYEKAIEQTVEGYSEYLKAIQDGASHASVLKAFAKVRLLCALTEGMYGLSGLNSAIENSLIAKKLIAIGEEKFYSGRPVMVTQNDHGLGLYNGDIGIVLNTDEGLRVVFELADGSIKAFLPSRLPEHQTAYAMTVHKSQGSEFEHTIVVFPTAPCPVMTRELVYTGVTRAKNWLYVYASHQSLVKSIDCKTERFSGLTTALSL